MKNACIFSEGSRSGGIAYLHRYRDVVAAALAHSLPAPEREDARARAREPTDPTARTHAIARPRTPRHGRRARPRLPPIAHEREEGGGRDGDDGVAPRVALNADEAAVVAAAGVGGVGFVEAFREGQHAATLRWTLPEFCATRARQLWGDAKDVGGHECRLLVYPKGDTAALPGYSSVLLEMRAKAPAARADSAARGGARRGIGSASRGTR